MPSLTEIEGIGMSDLKRLAKQGIKTTQALLAHGYDRGERKKLAQATGLSEASIKEMVSRADMLQVRGIGPEYAGLLESVGVDNPQELKSRDPEKLTEQIAKTNRKKKLVRRLPTLEQIKAWILDATAIPGAPHGLAGEPGTSAPPPGEPPVPPPPPPKKRFLVKY